MPENLKPMDQMYHYIDTFPEQLILSHNIKRTIPVPNKRIDSILICGMGGSGIAGKVIARHLEGKSRVPVFSLSDYELPKWVNENTLCIISSYSGNTEESLILLDQIKTRSSQISIVTSGGKLLEMAERFGYPYRTIKGGEQPRAMFGYNIANIGAIISEYGFWDGDFAAEMLQINSFLNGVKSKVIAAARYLAEIINERSLLLYADHLFENVLVRIRQQLNENSKILCTHHVFPEMNHNELVAWANINSDFLPIFFKSNSDNKRNRCRMEFCQDLLSIQDYFIVESEGSNELEDTFYFLYFGDWLSYCLAEVKGVDPINIDILLDLKRHMSSFS